jgi:iron-sulfur cluster assembly protein
MISLTDRAEQQIIQLLTKRGCSVGIRIGVKTTGCSGLAYVLEYLKEDKFDPADERFVYKNFVVKVSTKDVVYLKGLVVDYVKNGLNEGFEFRNPNERDRCGCGESFRV